MTSNDSTPSPTVNSEIRNILERLISSSKVWNNPDIENVQPVEFAAGVRSGAYWVCMQLVSEIHKILEEYSEEN